MTEQEFAAGHVFFQPGDPAERAFLLLDGHVDVFHGPADGGYPVARHGPGDVFGEMSLVQERRHGGTARAATAVRVSPVTRDEFEQLLTDDPARCRSYLRSLFERLRSLTARAAGEDPELPFADPDEPGGPAELPPDGQGTPAPPGLSVVLYPLTPDAAETLPDEGLKVTRFPLRIGRAAESRERGAMDLNDVWLLDEEPFDVSRNHCELDLSRRGLVVRDRGSRLGCVVDGKAIGGRAWTQSAKLPPGDHLLVLGLPDSPYQFRVSVACAGD
jgi:CRP-like cAMP-binding protein